MEIAGSSIRFSGSVCGGLHTYGFLTFRTVGTSVVVASPSTERLLVANSGKVSCLDVSSNGKILAMGTATTIGVPADIYVWDVEQHRLQQTLSLHKGRVQSLSFSCCGTLLVSIGGRDDCSLVVWNLDKGEALCGVPLLATDVKCFHSNAQRFASCGSDSALFIWQLDAATHKLARSDIQLGQYKRNFTRLQISESDDTIFAGSTSGDVAQVSTQSMRLVRKGPKPRVALSGVDALCCVSDSTILAAGSEGRVIALNLSARSSGDMLIEGKSRRGQPHSADMLTVVAEHKLPDGVTSLCPSTAQGMPITAGTRKGDIFHMTMTKQGDSVRELVYSAHCSRIHDLALPHQCSQLVASCSDGEIRLWDTERQKELLRIQQPSVDCLCLTISKDGSSLIAGGSDGTIRFYGPETGQLRRVLEGAHQTAVHAVAMSQNGERLYSGDASGFFKVWQLGPQSHSMLAALKEHKGAIHRIVLALGDREGTTACSDGSCILWDLETFKRRRILAAGSSIADACYSSDQSQLITAGANRKLTYWDCHTGEAIRELDASQTGPILSVAVHPDGDILACGGADKEVKLWLYNEGTCFATGRQHTGEVTRCTFTADGKKLITADSHGALCFWEIEEASKFVQGRQNNSKGG